ncbi:MAG: 50S ribosomal protein L9 [Candidatus Moraniibacteriota bacterium]|nr:MAG: 50S ribosomal protein L9 [Candidatus Moranbacteria bacterium]
MQTSVVFLETVAGVAKKGEVKTVSGGYARNFLFPKRIAEPGTKEALLRAESTRKREEKKAQEERSKLTEEAQALREREVRIGVKEKDGIMFGSVTSKDIVKALAKDGVVIAEEYILLEKPLKKLGTHELEADFGHGILVPFVVVLKGE